MTSQLQTKSIGGKKWCRSRIPVAKATKKPSANPVKSRTVTVETKPSVKSSRVKRVPDFNKLHHHWANKLEQKKQAGRTHTQPTKGEEIKAPVISGKENEDSLSHTSSRDQCNSTESAETTDAQVNFEIVPQSLDAILHDGPIRVEGQRYTLAVSNARPREIPGEFRIPPSMARMSFYSRKPRHCKQQQPSGEESTSKDSTTNLFNRLVQSTIKSTRTVSRAKRNDNHSSVRFNLEDQFSQVDDLSCRGECTDVFNRLVQTTINSTRTLPKIDTAELASFSGVKLKLEDELTQAETESESEPSVEDHHLRELEFSSTGSLLEPGGDGLTVSATRPEAECVLSDRGLFYEVENELCAIFDRPKRVVIQCRDGACNPLSTVLDKYYFVPIESSNEHKYTNASTIFHS